MRPFAIACLIASSTTFATACLWDYDTLREERERFPDALELIIGKFIRHSPEFYEWRIQDRKKRLEQDPDNLALYDDLAVAYDKTGNQAEAIASILKKEELSPGLYETAANLGTFHIHSGNFEEGLTHITRAIEINPDAHFGREVYQKLLVEYVLKYRTEDGIKLPLYRQQSPESWAGDTVYFDFEGGRIVGFARFVLEQRPHESWEAKQEELERAVKGIEGMMRFGHYDSPILLEALGMLLLSTRNDAKQLAARAFLRAGEMTDDPEAASRYRQIAEASIETQTKHNSDSDQMDLRQVEDELTDEVAEAEDWFKNNVRRDEIAWIEAGKDVELLFDAKYRTTPRVSYHIEPIEFANAPLVGVGVAASVIAVLLVGLLAAYLKR